MSDFVKKLKLLNLQQDALPISDITQSQQADSDEAYQEQLLEVSYDFP